MDFPYQRVLNLLQCPDRLSVFLRSDPVNVPITHVVWKVSHTAF